ncbi:MAG TPA: MoaD/ThiS family protein [Sphingomicrobium sp.]|nr:MoaD/ThiS family protein [Sphingomicrobium sp.]
MKVLFYGRLAEAIGSRAELDQSPGCSVAEVRRQLCRIYPSARDMLGRSRAFISDVVVTDDHLLGSDDEIEFLPPVSGG